MDLLGFLTLGLLGSLGHCAGMCAPFVLFVSRHHAAPEAGRRGVVVAQLWYSAGRIATYAALGAAAGAVGGVVQLAGSLIGVRRGAVVLAGAVLVVSALVALADLVPVTRVTARLRGWWPTGQGGVLFARVVGRLRTRVPGHPLITGLVLGLLPCGLLYSAVVASVARGGPLEGATALAVFGLGTAPALLGLSFADHLLARNRVAVNGVAQVFILAMGMRFLWMGL